MPSAPQTPFPRWRILFVVLLMLVPVPQALGQSLLAYTCEEVRSSPAPTPGTGIQAVDECSGGQAGDDEDVRVAVGAESDAVRGARDTAVDPPGAQGYPLISLAGTGATDEPVEIRITEPSVHSILVEDVPAYEELVVQFLPADSPDVGRASPCMERSIVSSVEERLDEEAGDRPADRDENVSVGEEVEGPRGGDRAEAEVRLYPTDGFCAAVDATARATVDRPLFSLDRQVETCTALACEHQTTDTAAPEDSTDENGTALFGPLMLYPGRWQVVRTDPTDVLQHGADDLEGAPPCENAIVVLCFDVRPCADTSDVLAQAPQEGGCLGPSSTSATVPLDTARRSDQGSDACSEERFTERDGIWYRLETCEEACSYHRGGRLASGEREVSRGGGAVFEAVETWDAWSALDAWQQGQCAHHLWQETDVAQIGLSIAGPMSLENRYSDTWNVTLQASARECDRYEFPRGHANYSPCHEAILKEPVIVVPDYRETRDRDRCEYPEFHPPYDDGGKCARVALDASVVTPHKRDERSHLYHTGGDGGKMPASMTENRSSSPRLACHLASLAASLFGTPAAGAIIEIGCQSARAAEMQTSPPEEKRSYSEWQGTFNSESGYRCEGGCWSLHNRLESNDGWERDQMAFGAMMEMRSCGEGGAPAYVAGTFLKGLAYKGPTGETHQRGGDASNRSAGHHYWGPGLTISSEVGVHVGEDAPSCPQERAS